MQKSSSSPFQDCENNLKPLKSKEIKNRVHVSVRLKPFKTSHPQSKNGNKNQVWRQLSHKKIGTTYMQKTQEVWNFDRVYEETFSCKQIFEDHHIDILRQAINGFNVTIFAYGQTSSGKTFTMQGNLPNILENKQTEEDMGIIPLSVFEIFDRINLLQEKPEQQQGAMPQGVLQKTVKIEISYLEIYNESVNDLLDVTKKNLNVREVKNKGVQVEGLSKIEVTSREHALNLLAKGNENKKMAEHKLSEKSSRSHTVFKIQLQVIEKNNQIGRQTVTTSEINLVDLAGSEGVAKAQIKKANLRESHNINKSLLSLSKVIYRLGEQHRNPQSYINFRDSKLTRILQKSLQGNSYTAIICTLNQNINMFHESVGTLNFGIKAKQIRVAVSANEIVKESPAAITQKICDLEMQIDSMKITLDQKEDIINNYREPLESLELESTQNLKIFLDDLQNQISQKNSETIHLEQENQMMERKVKKYAEEKDQVLNQKFLFEKERDETKILNFNLEKKIQQLQDQLKWAENDKKMLKDSNEDHIQKLHQAFGRNLAEIEKRKTLSCNVSFVSNHEAQALDFNLVKIPQSDLQKSKDKKPKKSVMISESPLYKESQGSPVQETEQQDEQFQQLFNLETDNLQMIGEIEKLKNQVHLLQREKQEQSSKFDQSKQDLDNKIKSLERALTLADVHSKGLTQQLMEQENTLLKFQADQKEKIQKIQILEKYNVMVLKDLDCSIMNRSNLNESVITNVQLAQNNVGNNVSFGGPIAMDKTVTGLLDPLNSPDQFEQTVDDGNFCSLEAINKQQALQIEQLEAKVTHLETIIQEKEDEGKQMLQQVLDVNQKRTKVENDMESLEGQISVEMGELMDQYENQQDELEEQREKILELEQMLEALASENAGLKSKKRKVSEFILSSKNDNKSAHSDITFQSCLPNSSSPIKKLKIVNSAKNLDNKENNQQN